MNSELQPILLENAKKIGDRAVASADSSNPLLWKTLALDIPSNTYSFSSNESIYSGSAGIIIYLLELFRYTQDEKYLSCAQSGMNRLISHTSSSVNDSFSLYTGRLGVSYMLARAFQITGQNKSIDAAHEIALEVKNVKYNQWSIRDLLNGVGGTLLGLAHLFALTNSSELGLELKRLLESLLIGTKFTSDGGLYWDRSHHIINGLCGMSHGSSGLGLVMLELGKLFGNDVFYIFAESAFKYEDQYFDHKQSNWRDLRKASDTEQKIKGYKDAYIRGDLSHFNRTGHMSAWCHGAPGIGLARLRAFELLHKEKYRQEYLRAVNNTIDSFSVKGFQTSFTLCHGLCGNAEILLEGKDLISDYDVDASLSKIALSAIDQYNSSGYYKSGYPSNDEDLSLFMGSTGIGYFFLRLIDPQMPSLLLPRINEEKKKCTSSDLEHLDSDRLFNIPFAGIYDRTFKVISSDIQLETEITNKISASIVKSPSSYNPRLLGQLLSSCTSVHSSILLPLLDVYKLENYKNDLESNIQNFALSFTENQMIAAENEVLIENETYYTDNILLILNPRVHFYTAEWNWTKRNFIENVNGQREETVYLLVPTVYGVIEMAITKSAMQFLTSFNLPNTYSSAVAVLKSSNATIDLSDIQSYAAMQIREALKSGILVTMDMYNNMKLFTDTDNSLLK